MYNSELMRVLNQDYEAVPVAMLNTHPQNARRGDVGVIADSVRTSGWWGAVVAQRSTGYILAGNHRYLAAIQEGADEVPVIWVDVDDSEAVRIMISDNGTSDQAGYNDGLLATLLQGLSETEEGLSGTGFDQAYLDELLQSMQGTGGGAGGTGEQESVEFESETIEPDEKGINLRLANVSIASPSVTPEMNSVYKLGRHTLVVTRLLAGWELYVPHLEPGCLLVPLPNPYVPFSSRYEEVAMVLVQPNQFAAGHLIDNHVSRYGQNDVQLVGSDDE